MDRQEFHIPINSNDKSALDCLAEVSGLSRQKLKQCMQSGCVWLERINSKDRDHSTDSTQIKQKSYIQRLRRAKKILNKHQVLHFYYDESVLSQKTSEAVLIEDFSDYSIWNKPTGMLSQGSKWGDHATIYRWAEKHLKPERAAFVVHRLDRAANGLIILAHKKSVATQFSKLFEQRQIEKYYKVEVDGDFSKMIPVSGETLTIDDAIDERSAISHIRMLTFNEVDKTSTLEVNIETGRKHQIRKHLSNIEYPIVGDRLYGNGNNSTDLQLQAQRLRFICPVTAEEREFTLDS